MKTAIHPKWNHQATVICACGNTFKTGSVLDEIRVDICSACHPFYTGSMKFVDVQGRVDRFEKMRKAAAGTPKKKQVTQPKVEPKSLRELLEEEKKKFKTAA